MDWDAHTRVLGAPQQIPQVLCGAAAPRSAADAMRPLQLALRVQTTKLRDLGISKPAQFIKKKIKTSISSN